MAYRVTTEPANRAHSGVSPRRQNRAPDNTLSRNVTIAGAALTCLCLAAAGVAVLGRDHTIGSLPNYVASHKALKIAWAEPEQQAQFERNPMVAAVPATPDAPETASRFDAAFDQLAVVAPAWTGPIPLPQARPRQITVAALPAPRQGPANQASTDQGPADQIPAFPDKPDPAPVSSGRQYRLMSYAPTRDVIFDTDITGSIGDAARQLMPAPAKPKPILDTAAPLPRAKPPRKRTVQEKLWGPVRVAALTPAAAMPDSGGIPRAPYDQQTAVYVISDKKVYMPDGSVLEAHSGYGSKMDDPRYVKVRMRGATPPHVYDLKMREALFHGVEAIRMLPIGGEDAIFGRNGILAHTYMLGPTGQSNGCVSFKDYDAFLDAFKAGKITRLAVIGRLD
jgi:hypothetical protein